MYLEITFAFGLGLLMATVDTRRRTVTAALFVALLVIAEGIVLTFTRAGLVDDGRRVSRARRCGAVGGTAWMEPCS